MKVKYIGTVELMLPTLGITVNKGDEIDVPDDFANVNFVLVPETTTTSTATKKGESN